MKKFHDCDWLKGVQFLGNTVPKKEIQCKFLQVFMLGYLIKLQQLIPSCNNDPRKLRLEHTLILARVIQIDEFEKELGHNTNL